MYNFTFRCFSNRREGYDILLYGIQPDLGIIPSQLISMILRALYVSKSTMYMFWFRYMTLSFSLLWFKLINDGEEIA